MHMEKKKSSKDSRLFRYQPLLRRRGRLGLARRAIFISAAETEELFWGGYLLLLDRRVVEGNDVQKMPRLDLNRGRYRFSNWSCR